MYHVFYSLSKSLSDFKCRIMCFKDRNHCNFRQKTSAEFQYGIIGEFHLSSEGENVSEFAIVEFLY